MVTSLDVVLAANLLVIRKRVKLSQAQMAQVVGVSRATYSELESGTSNPRLATLRSVANAINWCLDVYPEGDVTVSFLLSCRESDEFMAAYKLIEAKVGFSMSPEDYGLPKPVGNRIAKVG